MDNILSDILIILAIIILMASALLTLWSIVRSMRVNRMPKRQNGVPVQAVVVGIVVFTLSVAIITLLLGSVIDMCIITALVMLATASVVAIIGRANTLRRIRL